MSIYRRVGSGRKGTRDWGLGTRDFSSDDNSTFGTYPGNSNYDPQSLVPSPQSPIPDPQSPFFHCKGITKNYDGKPVVANISLELPQGGCISLLGPSGVGKTTLFNVLAGIDPPDGGNVYLNGEDITGVPGKAGYMPQKDLLLEHRTVLDNVILPLLIRGEKKKTARAHAAAFFPQFGLDGYEKKYPYQLSGGMRQRAALLRTYMTRTQVILLDEPFSALDAITRRQMQDWYRNIAQKMQFSTLFITHDVDEALMLSDTVYILNGRPGKIVNTITVLPDRGEQKREILAALSLQ